MKSHKECRAIYLEIGWIKENRSGLKEAHKEDIRVSWRDMCAFEKFLGEASPLPIEIDADNIIVRPFDGDDFLKTKLHVPDSAKGKGLTDIYREHPLQGIVLNVGPGWMFDNGIIRSSIYTFGDHVLIDQARAGMVQDFIMNGIIYYRVPSSVIIGKALPEYSESLESLKFITK